MRNLTCYVMAVSTLLSACGDSSGDDEPAATGGSSSTDGTGGEQETSGTGGSAEPSGSGGSADSTASATGGSAGADDAATGSGVSAASVVIDLSDIDLDKVCSWMESVLGLTRGATSGDEYSGTWGVPECAPTNESVFLWGSPDLCRLGLASGNAGACLELTVARLEACMTTAADDLCLILHAAECDEFYRCFQTEL